MELDELIVEAEFNFYDIRCVDAPNKIGDADVNWIVIDHHMRKHGIEIGRGKNIEAALRSAFESR